MTHAEVAPAERGSRARGSTAPPAARPQPREHPLLPLQHAAGNRAASALLQRGGAPLEPGLRAFFGARFGHDFRGVRVHRGTEAERAAASVGAAAFTVGADVVFGRGRYAPDTLAGHRLLAHELAHVVQQRPGGDARTAAGTAALEAEARRAARAALPGTGRVAVLGRSREGVAREPESLRGTPDVRQMDEVAIRREIWEIRAWLAARGATTTPDTEHLRGMLARLEERLVLLGTGMAPWADFAPHFNTEFAATLHAFTVPGAPAPTGTRPVGATGDPLTPAQLKLLFTTMQRDKLKDFISSRRIPERLFNGTDRGTTTAQQRLLLAAHILAKGIYRPGSFDQRVHARMCWHWVQIVHHYAGATPEGGPIAQGVMGGFDPLGGAVLGTGRAQSVWHGARTKAPELPETETPGGVGPLHPGTKHAEAAEAAAEADPTKAPAFHRQAALPFDRFGELRAGDWLWYYNANASGGGAHSVIFSHWAAEPVTLEDGTRYRDAVVYSQGTPKGGGRRHGARLGDRFVPDPKGWNPIVPITHVTRVGPDAAPATTPAELVPGPSRLAENEKLIRTKEKKLGRPVDRDRLLAWLRDRNAAFLAALEPHLTAEQETLITQANAGTELDSLVRLYQRLRSLSINAGVLDANMASTYATLDVKHAAAEAKAKAAREAAEKEIRDLDAELEKVRADTTAGEVRRTELDVDPEIQRLRKEREKLGPQVWKAKAGPEREAVKKKRADLQAEIDVLRVTKRERAAEMGTVRKELGTLASRKRTLEAKRGRSLKARDAAGADLPYGLVHPGKLGKDDRSGTTGKLADLKPQPDWAALLVPAPAAPAAAPKGP